MSIVSKPVFIVTVVMLSSFSISSSYAQTTTLPTLHVRPKQAHQSSKKQTALAIELTQKDIQQSGSTSITDLIRKQGVAHLQAGSGNPNQTMVSMDGFGNNASSNSIVLIDGIPVTSFTNVGPNLNNVITDNVASLAIQPGSQGVVYGSQAVSGVINIKTRIPNKTIFRGNLGVGNMHQVMVGMYASARPVPQWGYNLGIQSDYNHHAVAYNKQQNTTFNLNIHHYGLNNLTTMNVLSYVNESQMPAYLLWRQPDTLNSSATAFTMSGNMIYLTNKHVFNAKDDWQTRLAVYQTSMKTAPVKKPSDAAQIDQRGLYFSNQWHRVKSWLVGLDNRYNNYNADLYGMKQLKAQGNIVSPYIRKQLNLTSYLSSTFGVRYAWQYLTALGGPYNIHENNHAWANEESLTDQLNKHWKMTLRHASSYAFATGKDVMWRSDASDPALKTQTGDEYDFNVHWQKNNISNLISLYEINLQNEMAIRWNNQSFSEIYNLPATRRRGISLMNHWQFNPQWSLRSQLSYVDPRLTSAAYKNKMIPLVSLWNGSVALTYQTASHWLASIEETVHSSFYSAYDLQNAGAQMPGYGLTNLHLQKQTRNVTYDLSIDNVFDRHYVQFANYSSEQSVVYTPADGISVLAHIDFNLLPNKDL